MSSVPDSTGVSDGGGILPDTEADKSERKVPTGFRPWNGAWKTWGSLGGAKGPGTPSSV